MSISYTLLVKCVACGEQGTPITFDQPEELAEAARGLCGEERITCPCSAALAKPPAEPDP